MINSDYKDMLLALSEENVKFMLVGGYALAAHGYPRADTVVWEGVTVRVLSLQDLLANKRASGRPKDQSDVLLLEQLTASAPTSNEVP